MKLIQLLLILCFPLLFSCNSSIVKTAKEKKFSDEEPYAIKIKSERSYFHADKIAKRINQMGLNPYIIHFLDTLEGSGDWFHILHGAVAEKDSAELLLLQMTTDFNFNQAEIVNYHNYEATQSEIEIGTITEQENINGEKPDLPQKIFDLLKAFPENNSLYVSSLSIVNSPEDPNGHAGIGSVYKLHLDLPRGLTRRVLLEANTCFAEVSYRDNLYNDKVIIDIGHLRKNEQSLKKVSLAMEQNDSLPDIANKYADMILNTGHYPIEEKTAIEIGAKAKLRGYKVSIELWNNKLRTYLVLVDQNQEYLVLSQSTDKSEEELIKILEGIGKGEGLLNYTEFYNTFYTLPANKHANDRFTAFALNRIEPGYASNKANTRWAREMVGHWQSTAYFYNKIKGNWSYSLFDLLTEKRQKYIYKSLYWNHKSKSKKFIDVCGTQGIHITKNKFNFKKFKNTHRTLEINFGLGRYVCAIDNTEKSVLSKTDIIKKAESLQLNSQQTDTEDVKSEI